MWKISKIHKQLQVNYFILYNLINHLESPENPNRLRNKYQNNKNF